MYKYFSLSTFLESLGNNEGFTRYDSLFQKSEIYFNDIYIRQIVVEMEESTRISEAEQKVINTNYQAFTFIIFLMFVAFFLLNNSRKKRFIAVQEKEIEIQKKSNLIKGTRDQYYQCDD